MANNFFKIKKGENLEPIVGSTVTAQGDLAVNSTSNQIEYHNGSTVESLTTTTNTQALTNKTISGASNTLSNIAYSSLNLTNSIVNADINASAAIVDTKLANISTAGKVSNSATTATSSNTNSTIVARDGSGNFSAGTITASLSGNATTATTATNVSGTVAIANGGTGQTNKTAAFDALSPTTTKGDISIYNGTNNVRQAVGTDNFVLTADSSQTTGIKWAASASSVTSSFDLKNLGLAASVSTNILTVSLKQSDGSTDPGAGTSSVQISFRDSTLANGDYLSRSVTSSLSITTIGVGASFGTTSGQNQYLYIYAIDNAGTVELAIAGSRTFDEGNRFSTTAIGVTSNDGYTLYSTTARTNVAVRLIGRLRVNEVTAGTYLTAPSEIAVYPFIINQSPRSDIWLIGRSGYGSSGTTTVTWTTVQKNVGAAMVLTQSATAGDSILILEPGVYGGMYSDASAAANPFNGISVNSTGTSTNIESLAGSQILTIARQAAANITICASFVGHLNAGDIIRAQSGGNSAGQPTLALFRVTKLSN